MAAYPRQLVFVETEQEAHALERQILEAAVADGEGGRRAENKIRFNEKDDALRGKVGGG